MLQLASTIRTYSEYYRRPLRPVKSWVFWLRFAYHIQALIIGLEIGYNPVIFFAKLSLFLLYLSAFAPSRKTRIFVYIGIASISVVYTGTAIGYGVLCIPKPGSSWFVTVLSSNCANKSIKLAYVMGSFGVVSDFYLFCLPIPVILRLQMPRKKKIAVCAIFMTGFLWVMFHTIVYNAKFFARACISSILGLYFRVRIAKSQDVSWNLGLMEVIVYDCPEPVSRRLKLIYN